MTLRFIEATTAKGDQTQVGATFGKARMVFKGQAKARFCVVEFSLREGHRARLVVGNGGGRQGGGRAARTEAASAERVAEGDAQGTGEHGAPSVVTEKSCAVLKISPPDYPDEQSAITSGGYRSSPFKTFEAAVPRTTGVLEPIE